MIVGLLVGTVKVLFLSRRLSTQSLAHKVAYKTLFYVAFRFGVILITFPIAVSMELDTNLVDGVVWERLGASLLSTSLVNTVIQLSTMLVASLFYAKINEYMGHSRYFELLRAYFQDLSPGIVSNAGEIYQYVGDEVVVSWPVEDGLRNNNCINCFLAMKADLKARAEWYRQEFGVAPDFKAGLHIGNVTTGEIGALKKEIIFTGDTLNATARIQSLCNTHGVDLLISGDLLSRLPLDTKVNVESLGQCELRGRSERIELHTIKFLESG